MKKHRFAKLFLFVFIINLNLIYAQTKIDYKKLDNYIADALKKFDVPGFAVGIIKDNNVVFEKGYGIRSAENNIPVDNQTLFGIGSCSKTFGSTCLGILVDEGKLDWNDKVIDYLPWFRLHDAYVTRELTIGDLLCHRSGLGTFDGDLLWFGTDYTSEEVVKRIRELPLKNRFRSQFGYQNVMFIAAGLVVEAMSGKSWHAFVKEQIFKPLQMNNSTTIYADLKTAQNIALPHFRGKPISFINFDNAGPVASVYSSVGDLLKWLKMWINIGKVDDKQFLSQRTVRAITSSQMVVSGGAATEPMGTHFYNYGYGWSLRDYCGRKVIEHGGAVPGYFSYLLFVPEEKLGIVALTNDLKAIHTSITYKILDLFMNNKDRDYVSETLEAYKRYDAVQDKQQKERESKRIPNTSHSLQISAYTGRYIDKMYGNAEIIEKDGDLILTLLPSKELYTGKLEHFHYDTFKVTFNDPFLPFGLITFHFNSNGEIHNFTIDLPNQVGLNFNNLNFEKARR